MMIRRVYALLLFIPLLSGCWDYKDLDRLSVVTGMAVDPAGGGRLKVTLEVTFSSGKEISNRAVAAEGATTDAAVREAKKQLEYELYYGNMGIVVFGKSLDIEASAEWLKSVQEIRETLYIAASEEPAGELLQSEDGVAAFRLRNILDASETVKPVELYRLKDSVPLFIMSEDKFPLLAGSVSVNGAQI